MSRRPPALVLVACLASVLLPAGAASAADATLRGTLVSTSGSPLPEICVDVHEADDPLSRRRVQTNADGRFATTVSEGAYRLRFVDCVAGQYAASWYEDALEFGEARVVTVTADGANIGTVSMERAGRISGVVTLDGSGSGVADACVVATHVRSPSLSSMATTDDDGYFTVAGLAPGGYLLEGRDCRDRALARSWHGVNGSVARGPDQAAVVEVAPGATAPGTPLIAMRAAAVISGTVRGPGDAPLEGICVTANDGASSASRGTTTAADGTWRIGELLPGTWTLEVDDCRPGIADASRFGSVWVDPSGAAEVGPVAFDLARGGTTFAPVDLRPGGALAGRVTVASDPAALSTPTSSGQPARGVCVGVVAPGTLTIIDSTVTDGDGRFGLGGLLADAGVRVVFFDCDERRDRGLEWHDDELTAAGDTTVSVAAGRTVTVDAALGAPLRRAAGGDRRGTANQLALAAYPDGADAVLIARQDIYPDALAGGPLATALGAPILLSPPSGLTPDVIATLRALDPDVAYILGGPTALDPFVEQQLAADLGLSAGDGEVFRFNGDTRFATAAQIARFLTGGTSEHAYLVEGANADPARGWPDAVAVSGLAAFQGRPILLVTRDALPADTSDVLVELGVEDATVVGGPVAVAESTFDAVDVLVERVERVSGGTRYDTSAAIVDRSLEAGMWSRTAWIATGQNFPDALVAGAVVGRDGGILQLLPGSDVTQAPDALATFAGLADGISRTILLGGPVAISDESERAIEALLAG